MQKWWMAGSLVLVAAAIASGCGRPAAPLAPVAGVLSTGGVEAEAARTGYTAYHGIQHTHVAENGDDGQGTLAEAYAYAHDKAHLDYLGVSSHSHMITDDGYQKLRAAAGSATQDGKFVALVAQEWSSISKGGHINIFDANARCDVGNGDWEGFYGRWLPAHPEVAWCQFNHPHPTNPLEFGGIKFSPISDGTPAVVALDRFAGMALLNGPGKYNGEDMHGEPDDFDKGVNKLNYEEEYKGFLNRGWHLGAVGDQDNHVKNWGTACPTRTGVWAKALTHAGLVEAFRARRTFAAWDSNVNLWLTLNGYDMGSIVDTSGPVTVRVTASDPDTTIKRVELYADTDGPGGSPAQLVAQSAAGKQALTWSVKLPAGKPGSYYFAKLVYDDQKAWAWSSPIWTK